MGAERGLPADRPSAGHRGLGGVEHHAEPAPAGVDDAGLAQHRELLRGVGEGLAGGGRRGAQDVPEPQGGVLGGPAGALGGRPRDGQDGALDGPAHGGVPGLRGQRHALGEDQRGPVLRPGLAEPLAQRADQRGQDHPGVAAGAEQRAPGERGERRAHVRRRRRGGRVPADRVEQGGAGGLDGEVEVGAGVPVGHRVDVERVDLLAGLTERGEGQVGEPEDGRQVEGGHPLARHRTPPPALGVRVGHGVGTVRVVHGGDGPGLPRARRPAARFASGRGRRILLCGCPDRCPWATPESTAT